MLARNQRGAVAGYSGSGGRKAVGDAGPGTALSPYYLFGHQRWYAYQRPHGLAMPGTRAAAQRELGSLSGLRGSLGGHTLAGHTLGAHSLAGHPFEESAAPIDQHYPSLRHHPSLGDWPALRPAGPEPLDPGVTGEYRLVRHTGLGFSDMEKKAGVVLALGAAAFVWWRRRKRGRRR